MPRIPDAQFRTDPSVRVENEYGGKIDPTDTKQLRQLGGQFVKISEQMELAKRTAEGLDKASKLDKLLDKARQEAENIKLNSRNGKIKRYHPNRADQREASITEEFGKISEAYQQQAQALLSGEDIIATEAYVQHVLPSLQKMQGEMAVLEKKQVFDYHKSEAQKQRNTIKERWFNGQDITSDLQNYYRRLELSIPVLGEEGVAEEAEAIDYFLGMNSSQYVKLNSPTQWEENAAVKEAKKRIAKLPEAERLAAERQLGDTVEAVGQARYQAMIKSVDEAMEMSRDPKQMVANAGEMNRIGIAALSEDLHKFETKTQRSDLIGKIYGNFIGAQIGNNMDSSNLADYDDMIDKQVKQVMDTFKNSNMVKTIGRNSVEDTIRRYAQDSVRAFQMEKYVDLGGAYEKRDDSFVPNLMSGDPIRQNLALNDAITFGKQSGLAEEDIVITPAKLSEGLNKSWESAIDDSGAMRAQMLKDFVIQAGPNASRIMRETISRDGGKKIPSVAAIAIKVDDPKFMEEMMADYNGLSRNMEVVQTKINSGILKFDKSAKKLKEDLETRFAEDKFVGLYNGRKQENAHNYMGMKQAIVHRAIRLMAQQGLDESESYDRARADVMDELAVANYKDSSIMVSKKFRQKFRPSETELSSTLKDIREFKHLDRLNVSVDFEALSRMAKNSPILNKYAKISEEASKAAGKFGFELAHKMLAENLDDELEVVTDPDNPDRVKVYINPMNGLPRPLPMKNMAGQTEDFNIDLNRYFPAKRSKDVEAREKFINAPLLPIMGGRK